MNLFPYQILIPAQMWFYPAMRWVLGPKGYQLHEGEKQELFVSFDFVRHGTTNEVCLFRSKDSAREPWTFE